MTRTRAGRLPRRSRQRGAAFYLFAVMVVAAVATLVSAAPAFVQVGTGVLDDVHSWAGPWPVEERWWDTARARRLARFQVLTGSGRLLLLMLERGQWQLVAEYC